MSELSSSVDVNSVSTASTANNLQEKTTKPTDESVTSSALESLKQDNSDRETVQSGQKSADGSNKKSADESKGTKSSGGSWSSSYSSYENDERGTWKGDQGFLIASVGLLVGLGNIWKFPYLVFKNGGGAFLLPYFICVVFGGLPLIYLEVAIGQFMRDEGVVAWNIVPLFQGIAVTQLIVQFYTACYYSVIIAWAIYYFIASFAAELPWAHCENEWNTANCSEDFSALDNATDRAHLNTPTEEFWQYRLLGISDGIEHLGELKWDLAFCLLLAWFVVYCAVCKGILTTGKIMYVTITIPYVILLVLLVQHSLLDGAADGLLFYLDTDLSRLADIGVWKDAGIQVFFSSSTGFGVSTVLGSYNKFNHDLLRDSIMMSFIDSITSFMFGFLVFTVLGFMAKQEGRSVADVTASGPGLAFIAYPTAVAGMPLAPVWSVLFFLMVILIGLDSLVFYVEPVVNAFVTQFPSLLRFGKKDSFASIACGVFCFCGLVMVTKGGLYVVLFFDYYSGGPILLFLGFCELVAISYAYGTERFCDNLVMMHASAQTRSTLPFFSVCWRILSPGFCLLMIALYFMDAAALVYEKPNREVYHYPAWTVPIGCLMALSSVLWIPLIMVYKFVKYGADEKALKLLTVPYYLQPFQKRPEDENEECLYDFDAKVVDNVKTEEVNEKDKETSKQSEVFSEVTQPSLQLDHLET